MSREEKIDKIIENLVRLGIVALTAEIQSISEDHPIQNQSTVQE